MAKTDCIPSSCGVLLLYKLSLGGIRTEINKKMKLGGDRNISILYVIHAGEKKDGKMQELKKCVSSLL